MNTYLEEAVKSASKDSNIGGCLNIYSPCHRISADERRIVVGAIDAERSGRRRRRLIVRLISRSLADSSYTYNLTYGFGLSESNPMILSANKIVLIECMMLSCSIVSRLKTPVKVKGDTYKPCQSSIQGRLTLREFRDH